jgi:molecular chaperone DnaK
MSKEDIDRAVKEAEQFAEEDKKARETVDLKNNAESLAMQVEKALNDFGDKVSESEKAPILEKCNALKEAIKTDNTSDIQAKYDELQKLMNDIATKVYQQSAPQGDPNQQGGFDGSAYQQTSDNNNGDDDVIDADFTEEK